MGQLNKDILLLEKLTGRKVLLEDPDTTMRSFEGVRRYTDTDAFPFCMDNEGDLYVGSKATLSTIGPRGALHDEIRLVSTTTQIKVSPEIKEKYKYSPPYRENSKYPGRLWTIGTLISFWEFPESQAKLFEILGKLQTEMKLVNGIDVNLSNPTIEILVESGSNKFCFSNDLRKYGLNYALVKALNYDDAIKGKAHFEKKEVV